jgi:UDP-GlcNAc:undecaprenyl-phosphate/decaprenyl-phosphate GlcNAc-1-phosphate transferase
MSYDLLLCIMVFTIVGIIDDVKRLRAVQKLSLQLAAAIVCIVAAPQASIVESIWTIAWLVVITNAFNLIDGIDGLAISYACIVFGWALFAHGPDVIIFTLLGACLGFLPFNIYKAKFYLGDSGSHALGSAIGWLTVPFIRSHADFQLADLVIVTLPLADIVFVTITRRLRRHSITTGGTDHIAHRLARLVGPASVVPLLMFLTVLLGFFSLQARNVSIPLQVGFTLIMWADMLFLVTMLEQRTRRFFT